jgi:hypothetical protein
MRIQKLTYDGKEMFFSYLCGYNCYFHKDLVKKVNRGNQFDYSVDFPIEKCDIVNVEGNLIIIPGNYNLFLFPYGDGGKIEEVDNAVKLFDLEDSNCAIILSAQDKIKIKWSDDDGQCVTLVYKDGRKEDVPTEEILKYL